MYSKKRKIQSELMPTSSYALQQDVRFKRIFYANHMFRSNMPYYTSILLSTPESVKSKIL